MALDFPTSPALNQVYTFGSYSWRWDGTSWVGAVPIVNATINNTTIGAVTPSTGAFTTITANTSAIITGGASIGQAAFQATGNQASQLIANLTSSISGAGTSFGLRVAAGTNASDYALRVLNQAGTLDYLFVKGDGAVSMSNGLAVTGALSTLATNGVNTFESAGVSSVGLQFRTNSNNRFKIETPSASADLAFYAGGTTETVRLTSSGNVGIGTTSPLCKTEVYDSAVLGAFVPATRSTWRVLQVKNDQRTNSGSAAGISFQGDNANGDTGSAGIVGISTNTTGGVMDLAFLTAEGNASLERMRILASGNVGIGTTNPGTTLDVQTANASLRVYGTGASDTPQIQLRNGSQIWQQIVDGADSHKWKLRTGGGTTVLNCDPSAFGLAVTGALSSTAGITTSYSGGDVGIRVRDTTDTSDTYFMAFQKANSTIIGSIRRVTTTDAVIFNTSSDLRLKENLRDFTDSGRLIDSLKPRVFDWKNSDENGKNVIGFIAQEQHAADPIFAHIGAVSVGDEDPETITKQWQRSDSALIPILVAELKSLRARVAALETN